MELSSKIKAMKVKSHELNFHGGLVYEEEGRRRGEEENRGRPKENGSTRPLGLG